MEKKKKITIGVAVGVAALAGFLIYQNWDKIKEKLGLNKGGDDSDAKKDTDKNQSGGGSGTGGGTTQKSYKEKVMDLQSILGVAIDGDAGKQTNGMLDYYWADFGMLFNADKSFADGYTQLKKNGKGVVSASNVDYYISTLNAKKSPRQVYWVTQKGKTEKDAEVTARKAFGKKLFDLGATGSKVVAKTAFTSPVRTLDASRGVYIPTGGNYNFSPTMTHLFSTYEIAGYNSDGFYILKYKSSPKNVTIVNPYLFQAV